MSVRRKGMDTKKCLVTCVLIAVMLVFQTNIFALTQVEWQNDNDGTCFYNPTYKAAQFSIDTGLFGDNNVYVINAMSEFERMFNIILEYKIRSVYFYVKNENTELPDKIKAKVEEYSEANSGVDGFKKATYTIDDYYVNNKYGYYYHPYQEQNGKLINISFSYYQYVKSPIELLPKIKNEENLYDLYRKTRKNKTDMSDTVVASDFLNSGNMTMKEQILSLINQRFRTSLTEENVIVSTHRYKINGEEMCAFRLRLTGKGENVLYRNIFSDDRMDEILRSNLLKKITPDMDDYTKVKIIARSVGAVCKSYCITNRKPNEIAIADETGQCMHYSTLFRKMCEINGIESTEIVGNDETHQWNLVKISGEWYHVDVTGIKAYDQRVIDNEKTSFVPADDSTLEDRGYTWDKSNYTKCTSTRFVDDEKYSEDPYYPGNYPSAEIEKLRETAPNEQTHVLVDEIVNGPMTSYRKYAAVVMDDERGRLLDLILQNADTNGEYEIPSEIDGITVRSIGRFAIRNFKIKKLIFPETLEEVSEYACWFHNKFRNLVFKGHTTLAYDAVAAETITAPEGLEIKGFTTYPDITISALNIGEDNAVFYEFVDENTAFVLNRPYNFDAVVPQQYTKLLYLGGKGYYYDEPWNTLSIHKDVSYIDPQIGYLNRYYIVDENNPNYSSVDGVLYNKDKTKLISVPIGIAHITLPDTVKEIGRFAFAFCYNLKEVVLPETVTTVDSEAFYKLSGLKDIVICGNQMPQGLKIDSAATVTVHCSDVQNIEGAEVINEFDAEATFNGEQLSLKRRDKMPIYVLVYNIKDELIDALIGHDGEITRTMKSGAYKIKVFCLSDDLTPLSGVQTLTLSDLEF